MSSTTRWMLFTHRPLARRPVPCELRSSRNRLHWLLLAGCRDRARPRKGELGVSGDRRDRQLLGVNANRSNRPTPVTRALLSRRWLRPVIEMQLTVLNVTQAVPQSAKPTFGERQCRPIGDAAPESACSGRELAQPTLSRRSRFSERMAALRR
jgi:hypothetical protein